MLAADLEPRRYGQKEEGRRHCGSEERAPRARCLLQRRGRWWGASGREERVPLLDVEEGEVGRCCLREVRWRSVRLRLKP